MSIPSYDLIESGELGGQRDETAGPFDEDIQAIKSL